jgi:anti-sigma factor RsiW
MICLSKHEQGADLLTGYLAKTLDAARTAELDRHFQECADCRGLVIAWERLDEFAAPAVSAGFDARLYARIAAEGTRVWWRRLLWRPLAPLAAAGALVALALFVRLPGAPDAPQQPNKVEIEQVAQAVDDLDLLTSIDR